jgi:TetR/AcrR family transcriptional regulator, cholesterol catabolism regulator
MEQTENKNIAPYQKLSQLRLSKFDEKLIHILKVAAKVISDEGFDKASVRMITKATGISLASLYYYFQSKEELLFLIQFYTFDTLVNNLKVNLAQLIIPEEKIRFIIKNHIKYFTENMYELMVCSHELETLKGEYYEKVSTLRKEYFDLTLNVVEALMKKCLRSRLEPKLATLFLFGILNWIYTWFDPEREKNPEKIIAQVYDLYINGIKGGV